MSRNRQDRIRIDNSMVAASGRQYECQYNFESIQGQFLKVMAMAFYINPCLAQKRVLYHTALFFASKCLSHLNIYVISIHPFLKYQYLLNCFGQCSATKFCMLTIYKCLPSGVPPPPYSGLAPLLCILKLTGQNFTFPTEPAFSFW